MTQRESAIGGSNGCIAKWLLYASGFIPGTSVGIGTFNAPLSFSLLIYLQVVTWRHWKPTGNQLETN
jgi:hypothetical protein